MWQLAMTPSANSAKQHEALLDLFFVEIDVVSGRIKEERRHHAAVLHSYGGMQSSQGQTYVQHHTIINSTTSSSIIFLFVTTQKARPKTLQLFFFFFKFFIFYFSGRKIFSDVVKKARRHRSAHGLFCWVGYMITMYVTLLFRSAHLVLIFEKRLQYAYKIIMVIVSVYGLVPKVLITHTRQQQQQSVRLLP